MSANDNTIYIFDTTLRDGEQAPGFAMSIDEKLIFAHQLAKMKVDIIESGFPVSSPVQFEASKRIAGEIQGPVIAGLARAVEKDIKACYDAVKDAEKARIHTFIATSPIHMEYKLKKKPEDVLKMAVNAVKYSKSLLDDVEFSAEDATRTDLNFLCEIVEAVIEAGATTVNIPDTVGYTVPIEYHKIIRALMENVKNINNAIISVHCHNDLGLSVSNSLQAVHAGARQVECTINGIGERAGNASLEEIVMTMFVRNDLFNVNTNIDKQEIYKASRMLCDITGIEVQPNKAIVGKNAFSHEAGIHQDGVLKHKQTYEIMTPESIGRPTSEIVLGRHSGKHAFKDRLNKLGFEDISEEDFETAYEKFLDLADKKKEVFDDDLLVILDSKIEQKVSQKGYNLKYLNTVSGKNIYPTATVVVIKDNEEFEEAGIGDGPIDAFINAIEKITKENFKIVDYSVKSITVGKDAYGKAYIRVMKGDNYFSGHGASTDIIEASCIAYLEAINSYFENK